MTSCSKCDLFYVSDLVNIDQCKIWGKLCFDVETIIEIGQHYYITTKAKLKLFVFRIFISISFPLKVMIHCDIMQQKILLIIAELECLTLPNCSLKCIIFNSNIWARQSLLSLFLLAPSDHFFWAKNRLFLFAIEE